MYIIQQLSDQLIFIQWQQTPRDPQIENQFLADLQKVFDTVTKPVYVISDLRKGRLENIHTINRLAKLANHPNFAGGTAFSENPVTSLMVGTYARLSRSDHPKDEIWRTPEEALGYLESLSKGVTQGINWTKLLQEPAKTD